MGTEVLLDDVRTPGPRIRTPLVGCRVDESVWEGKTLVVVRHARKVVVRVRQELHRARTRLDRRRRKTGVFAVVDCPECGERRVDPRDVTVRARIDIDEWSYRFTCPTCARRAVASTSRAAALQAVEEGSELETWHRSVETHEPERDGPPMSLADLLDLRAALSEPDWLETLSRSADESADNRSGKNDSDR
jgi:predicted RNA-binding Zn-ribbon protein involved in translation (DUF1610 family)